MPTERDDWTLTFILAILAVVAVGFIMLSFHIGLPLPIGVFYAY